MQQGDLIRYIRHPETMDAGTVTDLRRLASDFPYFQPAHMLLSIAARRWDASVYQQSLKRTAITVVSRSHLFNLIHRLETMPAAGGVTEPAALDEKSARAPDARQEMDMLKVAEVSLEPEVTELPPQPVTKESPEDQLEKEIARQVVESFVEKEVLKTPELEKPVQAPREQPASFGDWLAFLKKNNGQPYSEIEEQVNIEKARQQSLKKAEEPVPDTSGEPAGSRKQKNKAIIDKIIEKNPGLIRTREEQKFFAPEAKAKESLLDNEHLMTETLARIYALQGNIGKAIRAYQILSLKYPQKSAYFATLIQQLKNNNNQ